MTPIYDQLVEEYNAVFKKYYQESITTGVPRSQVNVILTEGEIDAIRLAEAAIHTDAQYEAYYEAYLESKTYLESEAGTGQLTPEQTEYVANNYINLWSDE